MRPFFTSTLGSTVAGSWLPLVAPFLVGASGTGTGRVDACAAAGGGGAVGSGAGAGVAVPVGVTAVAAAAGRALGATAFFLASSSMRACRTSFILVGCVGSASAARR